MIVKDCDDWDIIKDWDDCDIMKDCDDWDIIKDWDDFERL